MVKAAHYFIRSLLVVAWIGIIYSFLMLPAWLPTNTVPVKSLRIYTWAYRIDENIVREFEQKTGIKVFLNYYESGEELLTKLEMMPTLDYDILLPSGFMMQRIIDLNLAKKIDKQRCSFLKKIYPEFLDMYFDPQNQYSIPLYWDVFGIGYNARMVQGPITLDLLFNKKSMVGSSVGMVDDSREAIFMAAQYLGIPLVGSFTPEQIQKIYALLYEQRHWVGAYSDSQQGYYLASDTFAVVAADREIIRRQAIKTDFVQFALIPQGSMLRIDNIVVSATTQKDDMIYQFLNYLMSDEVMLHHATTFGVLPVTKTVFKQIQDSVGLPDLYPGSDSFNKLVVFQHGLTQKQLNDFWVQYKSS